MSFAPAIRIKLTVRNVTQSIQPRPEEGNRGEPHLSDHDGGTDRTENNV
ncbi:MAG: hypothetical protein ACLR78_02905 [Roseburia sp.]